MQVKINKHAFFSLTLLISKYLFTHIQYITMHVCFVIIVGTLST